MAVSILAFIQIKGRCMDLTLIFSIVASLFLFAVLIIVSTIVGGWLVHKGKSTTNEPFLRKDSSPGAYSINTDGLDFPEQKPDENEEHILKKTETFLKSLGGGK